MDTEIEVNVEEYSITSLKAVRERIVKARLPVDRFTGRINADENSSIESAEFDALYGHWCIISLYFENNQAKNNEDLLRITSFSLRFSELKQIEKFECKIWLENQNGEKCSETKCELFLNIQYLTIFNI
jgi:hypothetical protein